MGRLSRKLRIHRVERREAAVGAANGAIAAGMISLQYPDGKKKIFFISNLVCLLNMLSLKGASMAMAGAAIGLACVPIAPVAVPVGFLVCLLHSFSQFYPHRSDSR